MKLDAGGLRDSHNREVKCETEHDLFAILGVTYIGQYYSAVPN